MKPLKLYQVTFKDGSIVSLTSPGKKDVPSLCEAWAKSEVLSIVKLKAT